MLWPLLLLWIIILLLIVILIICSVLVMAKYVDNKKTVIPENISYCSDYNQNLISIDNYNCCYIGGTVTASKYVPELNMVVNPISINYITACQGFCTKGFDQNLNTCIDGTGQIDFDRCVSLTIPENDCIGLSMPVAISGLTKYYANSATNDNCLDTRSC